MEKHPFEKATVNKLNDPPFWVKIFGRSNAYDQDVFEIKVLQ